MSCLICRNSALSITAAGVVCVPLVDGSAGASAMLGGGGAGDAVCGPGADDVEGPATAVVILIATVVGVVVLVVVAAVAKDGPAWANVLQTPVALSADNPVPYCRTQTPHPVCGGCRVDIDGVSSRIGVPIYIRGAVAISASADADTLPWPASSITCVPTDFEGGAIGVLSVPCPSDVRIHASSVPGRDSVLMESMSTLRLESRLRSGREALRLLEEEEYRQLEEGELMEPLEKFQGLGSASGLDTSPEWDISSPGEFTEEAASFHSVVRKAADYLDLPLSAAEVKTNLLTKVLHPSTSSADPLLPFNKALLEPIMDLWRKPVSAPAVNRAVARRHRGAPEDPGFLSPHPTPESLVVQASCSTKSAPSSFPVAPSDRKSKRMEQSSKKIFSSCSMALKAVNATCVLGRYVHALMDSAKAMVGDLPQEAQKPFGTLFSDAQAAAQQIIQSSLDTTDSIARAMRTSVATRRHAWLRSSGFSSDVQTTILDLLFDGEWLFREKADSALERFKESERLQSP
ncbi:hypothetical protein NDU88_004990 [Pleurodeles waltl]|uniref:Uncharacterized protein n=1 Tax=Pleurodeles waltl TaxID=8319 RepID=A0AAV7W9G9_PLEWA|nr:hypothetical protein NDU88_004990 [Pleurodeles waltl]